MHDLNIQQNIPLAPYTTLGVGGRAEYFFEATTEAEVRSAVSWARENDCPITILGGGSNVLISDTGVKGLVLRICFSEITFRPIDAHEVEVTVGGGVIFDKFIEQLVEKKLWGLENLSAIPGTVGAVPVQNVGAYGVEVGEKIVSVSVYDVLTNTVQDISHAVCAFGYRDSLFKKAEGKRYIILNVTFLVSSEPKPQLAYKDMQTYLHTEVVTDIARIRKAICAIRAEKFPDYTVVGTAGSFFKNPIITHEESMRIRALYADVPCFPTEDGMVKISLGFVLDKVCALKGYHEGNVGLYENQALVLVCTNEATAEEILSFSEKIIEIVFQKTGIRIEREVTILA